MGTATNNTVSTPTRERFTRKLSVPLIADGPKPGEIQKCLDGMHVVQSEAETDFVDSEGKRVKMPRKNPDDSASQPYLGLPYARVFWEMARGNLLLGVDDRTMYRRDRDDSGLNLRLTGFHVIASLAEGFSIDGKKAIKSMDRLARVMMRQIPERVQHGLKFSDCAYIRDRKGALSVGPVKRIDSSDPRFAQPFELSFDCECSRTLADEAVRHLRSITAEEHSAQNLARMFACPVLEPYKALSFLVFGNGGNGKGLLCNALTSDPVTAGLTTTVNAKDLLGGQTGAGGFSTQQEAYRLIGKLWALDQDADTVKLEQMTNLKKISTGDAQVGRLIGENAIQFSPRCTLVLMTNNSVIMPDTQALRRRQVSVRMKDGRTQEEFLPLISFIQEYGVAPFMMASAALWEKQGDMPFTDVEIGDPNTLTEHEEWLVDQIVANGFAITGDNPYKVKNSEHKNSVAKLGLMSTQKKVGGKNSRVLVVSNEQRFAPFRKASEQAAENAEEDAIAEKASINSATVETAKDTLVAFLAQNKSANASDLKSVLQISQAEFDKVLFDLQAANEIKENFGRYELLSRTDRFI